jgi:hypothetical protein
LKSSKLLAKSHTQFATRIYLLPIWADTLFFEPSYLMKEKRGFAETSLYDTNEIAISTWQWAVGQTHEYASHKLHTRCSAWYTVSFDSVWCGICTAWILLMVPCSLPCVPKNQLSQSLSNLQTTSKYSTSTYTAFHTL